MSYLDGSLGKSLGQISREVKQLADDVTNGVIGGGSGPLTVNVQSGASYQLVLTDAQGVVSMTNSVANTVTVPANATVTFPVGTQIAVRQGGSGQTTIAAAGGVTLNSDGGALSTAAQYAYLTLTKIATDTWDVSGMLALPTDSLRVLSKGLGLITQSFDSANVSSATGAEASGRLCGVAVPLFAGDVISGIAMGISVAAVAATHGQVAIYSKAYALLAQSADSPTTFQGTGYKELTLTATYTVPTTDLYYLCYFCTWSTSGASMISNAGINGGTFHGGARRVFFQDGLASLPVNATPSDRGSIPWLAAY